MKFSTLFWVSLFVIPSVIFLNINLEIIIYALTLCFDWFKSLPAEDWVFLAIAWHVPGTILFAVIINWLDLEPNETKTTIFAIIFLPLITLSILLAAGIVLLIEKINRFFDKLEDKINKKEDI